MLSVLTETETLTELQQRAWLSANLGARAQEGWRWSWWSAAFAQNLVLPYAFNGALIDGGLNFMQYTTPGAAANEQSGVVWRDSNAINIAQIPGGVNGEWGCVARVRVNALPHANGWMYAGSLALYFGTLGYRVPTNWVLEGTANGFAGINGPAIVLNQWATLAAFRKAGMTSFYVNGALIGRSALVYPTNPARAAWDNLSGAADAVSRVFSIAWQGVMAPDVLP